MKIFIKLAVICAIVTLISCSENNEVTPTIETELTEISSFTENGITISLYASETLFVGYNTIKAKMENQEGELLSGNVSITPMMQMMDMAHSAPAENTGEQTFNEGVVEFNVVFVMPSGEMGGWSLDFDINGTEISVPVQVSNPEKARLTSFVSQMDETTMYFVALINPNEPEVGSNDIEIAVFKRANMMDWPAVTGLSFTLEPWMVSMDHGSPNNEAPVHVKDGHYIGKVNFTMTGDWQIRLGAMQGTELCGEPYFDIFFQ